jgi:hypothetical protein
MLSAQHRDFDDKKQDATPYPRDFARWQALDYFMRPGLLKGRRIYVTLAATILAIVFSAATLWPSLRTIHQAGPVSKSHALIGQDCARCHDQAFQPAMRLFGVHATSVSDQRCSSCHIATVHNAKQAHEPACASCHREHQGHELLSTHIADRHCVECHGDLSSHVKPGEKLAFHATIATFNRDHPDFKPALKGASDPSKIKFNHKAHLELDLDALRVALKNAGRDLPPLTPGPSPPVGRGEKVILACANCHEPDEERKYFKPIAYENHCASCHGLTAALVGDFAAELRPAVLAFSKTPLPHKEPAIVRAVLRDRLVEFAQKHEIVAGKGVATPRPLPWKPATDAQWAWAQSQAKSAEAFDFTNKQWGKAEALTWCSHCHLPSSPLPAGGEGPGVRGLPTFHKTNIPTRWFKHSVFDHGSHRSMKCEDCHDKNAAGIKVADSMTASDVLLPTLQSCQKCHTGAQVGGARNSCVACHRYHGR